MQNQTSTHFYDFSIGITKVLVVKICFILGWLIGFTIKYIKLTKPNILVAIGKQIEIKF